MNILVIGGTKFLGRYIVEKSLECGHTVTLFNRGQTNPELFPGIPKIHGDRENDISLLGVRTWDAVIDTCGYLPRIVEKSASFLSQRVGTYVFISSGSVYRDFSKTRITENPPLEQLSHPDSEDTSSVDYGALKALCEQTVQRILGPDRTILVRSGLIVGPHDPTDRLTYWIHRIGSERNLLVPESRNSPLQFIYAGDLADWILRMIEKRGSGTFNATGPKNRISMYQFFESCVKATGSTCELEVVDEQFLVERNLPDWNVMPLWITSSDKLMAGFFDMDCTPAIENGLEFTDPTEVLSKTFEWSLSRGKNYAFKLGMQADFEEKLRSDWSNQQLKIHDKGTS